MGIHRSHITLPHVVVDDGEMLWWIAVPDALDRPVADVLAAAVRSYQEIALYVGDAPIQCSAHLLIDLGMPWRGNIELGSVEFECF